MSFPIDHYWSTDPEQFIRNVLDAYPEGFVTQLYRYYVHDVEYVGRQENLREDLIEALTLAGEDFDAEAIRGLPARHLSAAEWQDAYHISEAVEKQIQTAEKWVLDTYYS